MGKWLIYYGDGTKVYDQDCSPEFVPKRDVQVITVEDRDSGQLFLRSDDYYWWDYRIGRWSSGDIFGLFDYLVEPGIKVVLFGRTIGNEEYRKIMDLAMSDENQYMPRKSAYHPYERR